MILRSLGEDDVLLFSESLLSVIMFTSSSRSSINSIEELSLRVLVTRGVSSSHLELEIVSPVEDPDVSPMYRTGDMSHLLTETSLSY